MKPLPHISTYAFSLKGPKKTENEDSYLVGSMTPQNGAHQSSMLLAVADGMGGHGDGRTASSIAVDAVARHVFEELPQSAPATPDVVTAALEKAFHRARKRVESVAQTDGKSMRMGTTLTVIYVYDGAYYLAHAGDSRCYRLRDGVVTQLTKDHTMGAQLREQTEGTPAHQLVDDRWDNALANAVGGGCRNLRVEQSGVDAQRGDRFLLCSDGLSVLDDATVAALLGDADVIEAPRRLVDSAAAAGSRDDITALVAVVE